MEAGVVSDSSPVLADLDGDGKQEILVGAIDGTLYVRNQADGSPYWPNKTLPAPINSSPAVADLNGDGKPDVIVSFNGDAGSEPNYSGGVRAFDNSGKELWTYWMSPDGTARPRGVYASPAVDDVDMDGEMEVAVGGWDRNMHLIKGESGQKEDGNWPFHLADTCWSSAALADLDGNGTLEIIVGADISSGGYIDGLPSKDGGYLWVFEHDGTEKWKYYIDEAVYSSPAVGDINNDGYLEIVCGTSWHWYAYGKATTKAVYAWDRDGNLLSGFPASTDELPGFSSPALADFDGDGDLEIVIGAGIPGMEGQRPGIFGRLYAFHHDGSRVNGWPAMPINWQGNNTNIRTSPAIADYDNDGQVEIFCAMYWDVLVFNTSGQQILGTNTNNNLLATYYSVFSTPAIGDPDGDGKLEVTIACGHVFDPGIGYLHLWDIESSAQAETPWPMFHRNPQHNGRIAPPRLSVTPSPELYILHPFASGLTASGTLLVSNPGEDTIDVQVTYTGARIISVQPLSATVTYGSPASLNVTVDAADGTIPLMPGIYNAGTITLQGTSSKGFEVAGSPQTISILLSVGGELNYLPAIMKNKSW